VPRIERRADVVWEGNVARGRGLLTAGSGAFSELPLTLATRIGAAEGQTSPEELIAAAHAGCYSMALSNTLGKAGFTPTSIETTAAVHLNPPAGITKIELSTIAVVPGLDDSDFQKYAEETKAACPVSKALSAVEITLTAQLG
jgi:osmotically inducible protein OsmC